MCFKDSFTGFYKNLATENAGLDSLFPKTFSGQNKDKTTNFAQ